jgi:flagellar L-ring protein FlgH
MKRLSVVAAVLIISGCMYPEVQVPTARYDEAPPASRPTYGKGSIWQASSVPLVDDFKARRRGDIVTVVITEQASATKQATTGTSRDAGISASIPNFMGLETTFLADKINLNSMVKANTSSSFDGSGSTTRKDALNATISARVMDVLPNGDLRIEGSRSVKVNNEDQIILLEGTVRPRDISPDNMVSSTQVADARITYSGKGIINDRQQPGWMFNLLDKIWPF